MELEFWNNVIESALRKSHGIEILKNAGLDFKQSKHIAYKNANMWSFCNLWRIFVIGLLYLQGLLQKLSIYYTNSTHFNLKQLEVSQHVVSSHQVYIQANIWSELDIEGSNNFWTQNI
jgi:hypothetical protein